MCWYVLDMGQKEKHCRSGNSSNSLDSICRMHQVDSASHQIQPCKHVSDPTYGCTCSALMTILHNVLQTSTAHSSHLSFCSREERGRSRLPRTKCVGAGLPHDQCLQSAGALILDPMLYLPHDLSLKILKNLGRFAQRWKKSDVLHPQKHGFGQWFDDDTSCRLDLWGSWVGIGWSHHYHWWFTTAWELFEQHSSVGFESLTVLTWVRLWRGYKSQELR